jgi:predicted DNA-binding protein
LYADERRKRRMKLNITLDDEATKRFQAVKEDMGVKTNVTVLQYVISREYGRIQRSKVRRVFLPKEVYDLMEEAAKARGQTIDEYVEETVEPLLKDYKAAKMEASKHGKQN